MKKTSIVILLFAVVVLLSCQQQVKNSAQKNAQSEQSTKARYKIFDVVDSISNLYPKKYSNEIQKKKFSKDLFNAIDIRLKADNSYLTEIPLKFSDMMDKGNNMYILKFECGEYSTNDEQLKSQNGEYEINFAIFVEATEEEASELELNKTYHLKGKYCGNVNGNLVLPSGRVFDYNAHCYKTDGTGTICLGGYLFKKISVE